MIKETIKHTGTILIRSSLGKKWIVENTITNLFNDELAKAFYGGNPNCYLYHLAIGTGTTPATKEDTTLVTEVFRTNLISQTVTGYGQVMSEFTILDSDYSGLIEEIGFIGGTGDILLSRMLWHYTKSSTEELYFQRFDTLV
jgi:hypothetical protein